ncbi:MAG: LLM class F420-dependent oxidoreductase [Acidimicrobiales bacterium]|nr:LLM class F420-dependent oxidoreductase [Acidimicrobiales bacterium]
MTQLGMLVPQHEIGTDPSLIVGWARAVEDHGFAYLDIFDHVLGADVTDRPNWPGPYTHEHRFHEPFVLYGFLAAAVRLDLATGVLVLPQRQTALVAKQAAELDLLSGGRLRLGVGIGWNPVEHEALGCDFAGRARRYEEQIGLLRRLWAEPVVDFTGDHHRIDRAGLAPRPARPIPIWIGGGAVPPVLDRIGRLGDGWIVHDPRAGAEVREGMRLVRAAANAAGRDPDAIGLQGRIEVHGGLDRDRFRRALDAWAPCEPTHLSIFASGQGGAGAHIDLLPHLAALVRDHLDLTLRGAP